MAGYEEKTSPAAPDWKPEIVAPGKAAVNFRDAAYVKSVDQVEAATGINFLPQLSESVEAQPGTWLANVP